MRIGIDARSATHPQHGGFKTYATSLLEALAQVDHCNTYLVYTNKVADSQFLKQSAFELIPICNRVPIVHRIYREQVQMPLRIRNDKCDLVHFLSNTAPLIHMAKYLITIHDVIALETPESFSQGSPMTLWQRAILLYSGFLIPRVAKDAQAVITVSNFEKARIVDALNLPQDRVHVTHLAARPMFRPFTSREKAEAKQYLRAKYNLTRPFFLAVGYEPRKNINRVIQAWGLLDGLTRKTFDLVVICANPRICSVLEHNVASQGIESHIRIIGGLPFDEMLFFYGTAQIFVFPSLRESFGLPPLEAMACGTPVIASNTTSLPEVLGDAAILVDPKDATVLANAMGRIADSPQLGRELSEKGLQRSKLFSWQKTAEETLAIYAGIGI